MKRIHFTQISLLLGIALLASGCDRSEYYSIETYDKDPSQKVVTMTTYDPESKPFQFRIDPEIWAIEEWSEEEAINHVALVHTGYEDRSCFILPGTIGKGTPDGALVYDGSLLTESYAARTVEIVSGAGIRLLYAVGFDVEEVPYIFEINFPQKDQDECEIDAQPVINSFQMVEAPAATDPAPTEAATSTEESVTVEASASSEDSTESTSSEDVPQE